MGDIKICKHPGIEFSIKFVKLFRNHGQPSPMIPEYIDFVYSNVPSLQNSFSCKINSILPTWVPINLDKIISNSDSDRFEFWIQTKVRQVRGVNDAGTFSERIHLWGPVDTTENRIFNRIAEAIQEAWRALSLGFLSTLGHVWTEVPHNRHDVTNRSRYYLKLPLKREPRTKAIDETIALLSILKLWKPAFWRRKKGFEVLSNEILFFKKIASGTTTLIKVWINWNF